MKKIRQDKTNILNEIKIEQIVLSEWKKKSGAWFLGGSPYIYFREALGKAVEQLSVNS